MLKYYIQDLSTLKATLEATLEAIYIKEFIVLVFTKSVDSNFLRVLIGVTWNILGYSLFCERRISEESFGRRNCGH